VVPGQWLHRFASRCCSRSTREAIIEPLLADFQHQWMATDGIIGSGGALIRGYLAFWFTLMICAMRATLTAVASAPARLTVERVFVGLYALGIVFVIVYGFAWVRTGTLDPTAGLMAIRKLLAVFGPGLLLGHLWPRARHAATRLLVLGAFACAMAAAFWINPEGAIGIAIYNLLYLAIIWPGVFFVWWLRRKRWV
jgi:hypothetical protein